VRRELAYRAVAALQRQLLVGLPRYLATLPATIGPRPFEPESWVGMNQPRIRCFQESGVDHYAEPYPAHHYREP